MSIASPVAVACIALAALAGSALAAGDDTTRSTTRSTARYVCASGACPPYQEVDAPCYEQAQSRSRGGRAATDWIAYNRCMAESGWTVAGSGRLAVQRVASSLQPNVEDRDGTAAFVHVTPDDMPLRIAVGHPKQPPLHGSRAEGRQAAIEAMQLWETALQDELPWFRLEFVEDDSDAPVQINWKRRIATGWGGFGGISYRIVDGELRVGGRMEVSTKPSVHTANPISVDELRRIIAHEFGHVLGLGHCFDCDSAMNYSFETVERIFVTEHDVRTFVALTNLPNGLRVDGRALLDLGGQPLADLGGVADEPDPDGGAPEP